MTELGPLVSRRLPRTPRPTVWQILKEEFPFQPTPEPHAQRLAPLVRVDAPQEGKYDVWIGSHSPSRIIGAFVISEEANPQAVIYPRYEDW